MDLPAAVEAAFVGQAANCRDLGSPFTARLCEILVHDLDRTSAFGRRIFGWHGEPVADALALRACGALHALVRSGDAPDLAAVWPPHGAVDRRIAGVLALAVPRFDDRLARFLDRPPQTNEVARSAVILGGALKVAAETGLPLELLEIGASAGLNLGFDRHRYDLAGSTWGPDGAPVQITCDWRGDRPPLDAPLVVADRAGCDLDPLDAADPADRQRLLAYIWPDQDARLARAEAALRAAAAAGVRVERADAAAWLEHRLTQPRAAGRTRLIFHTVMWRYLPQAARDRITAAIAAAGAEADPDTPLAWLRMEDDGGRLAAGVSLTLWPGGVDRRIGRADYHGRWVEWTTARGA